MVESGERDSNERKSAMLCGEKSCVDWLYCPYRKPTQVDEERILRPTGEGLLRNSANWSRNFGRRDAAGMRPQRIGPSNCLPKTQVSAKSKDDV